MSIARYQLPVDTMADRLQWILGETGMSKRGLSLAAGMSPSYVAMIIRGDIGEGIAYENAEKLAKAGNVRVGWLLSGEGDPRDPTLDTSTAQPDPELLDTISQLVAEMDLPDDVAAKLRASPWEGGLPSYGTLRSYAMDLMLARKGKVRQVPPLEHTPTQDGMFLNEGPPKKRGR